MYQRIVIMGRLGRDPEMRYTPQGRPVTTMSVATDRRWSNQEGEQQEETTWFRVTAWGRTAENCNQYLAKGRAVLVEGRMQSRQYEDQQGQKRWSWDLVADRVVFLPTGTGRPAEVGAEELPPAGEDEIPY